MAAYTTIDDPEAHFQTVIYTGDGNTGRSITLPGDTDMQPDFVWLKSRGENEHHQLTDSVRGVNKQLYSHLSYGEATETDRITAFNSELGAGKLVVQQLQIQQEILQQLFLQILQVALLLLVIMEMGLVVQKLDMV